MTKLSTRTFILCKEKKNNRIFETVSNSICENKRFSIRNRDSLMDKISFLNTTVVRLSIGINIVPTE